VSSKAETAARQVLEVIPLVMRTLALELRRTRYTLAPVHFRLLVILAERPHNLTELAEKQAVSLPTMSNSVTTLVERGWVKRVRPAHDRRMVLVELTPAGRGVLNEILRPVEAQVTQLLASLSPAECDQLMAGCAILRGAFARAAEDTQSPDQVL
jgi:DNA-binding MarR family transcriptional regulator